MRAARIHAVVLLALGAPLLACAVGDQSPAIEPGPVTTQSQGEPDSGPTSVQPVAPGSPSAPSSGDDSGAPSAPTSDDAQAPATEDATAPAEDSAPPAPPPPAVDSGSAPACPGYAPPTTSANCDCDPAKDACTANGCYGGYYCKLSTLSCEKKPSTC
jgi:hypothetical protein